MGVLGFLVCALFFLYPLIFRAAGGRLRPAIWALVAIALGNVYSHSLIIRDNLFLLAAFSALFYAEARCLDVADRPRESLKNRYLSALQNKGFLFCAFLLLIGFAAKEVIGSFNSRLIPIGNECMRPNQTIGSDGWSSGIYKIDVPTNARQVQLSIEQLADVRVGENRTLHLAWYSSNRKFLGGQNYQINSEHLDKPVQITAKMPTTLKESTKQITAVLSFQACDAPANHSFSGDDRRLSFKVTSVIEF